jgi:4-hydroxy-tetrahydrodipicolinate reductase
VVGHGATGQAICRLLAGRRDAEVVAVFDVAEDRVGRAVAGHPELRVAAFDGPPGGLDVAVFATTSHLDRLVPSVVPWLAASINVVSLCEELGYPRRTHPELAQVLDTAARRGSASVLGAGANPGFVFDLLPLLAAASLEDVREVHAARTIDLGDYGDLVHRFGLGCPPEDFDGRRAAGEVIGHVGFEQSLSHVADVAGLPVDAMEVDAPRPVAVTRGARAGSSAELGAGTVCAVEQQARASVAGEPIITLTEYFAFRPRPGEVPCGDSWRLVSSTRELEVTCVRGVPSLATTVALACNVLRAAVDGPPGLLCMSDLPIGSIAARAGSH